MRLFVVSAIVALMAGQVPSVLADEVVIGLGYTDFSDDSADNSTFGTLEYHFSPFASRAGFDFSFGGIGLWDGNDDYFIGAGLIVTHDFAQGKWFVEFSEMPGYYHYGHRDNDLGRDLEFRSQLAVGYRLNPDWAMSASVSHISNASLGDRNPGANFAELRLHRRFGGGAD